MPIYIGLYKYTARGAADIKESPKRIAAAQAAAEKMGFHNLGTWVTMGEYDLGSVGEAPDDETAARFAVALSALGNVTTQTLRAFTADEFAKIVGGLP